MGNESATNSIDDRQNAPRMLDLLRARKRIYSSVKAVQRIYFIFILCLPVVSLVVAFRYQNAKPWVSLVALIVGAIDAMAIDPWRKQRIKTAARIQEEFDCDVLDLPWNQFTVGKRVSAEEINKYARPAFSSKKEEQLRNWYPEDTRNLPFHVARLVCQRANLWYDHQLRGIYRKCLGAIALLYFLGLLLFGWQGTVADFLLVILVPYGPFFTWVVREYQRHGDAVVLVDRLLSEIESSLEKFTRSPSQSKAQTRSRELQDAIYAHRSSSPLVSDLVYWLKRTGLERQMRAGAAAFIQRVKTSSEEMR